MRIVRVANFVTPRSGGLRTALAALGRQLRTAGHQPVLVIPAERATIDDTDQGRVITLPGPTMPGLGGYRVLTARRSVRAVVEHEQPDIIEVSDRFTLRWLGPWARSCGVPAVMVSHESVAGVLGTVGTPSCLASAIADRLNRASARNFDAVLCTTRWAGEEFVKVGANNLRHTPLGVDLEVFHPNLRDPRVRAQYAASSQHLIVHCGRLSPEKRVDRSIATLIELRTRGVDAVLVVAGDGPLRRRLARQAAEAPVVFLGHVADRQRLSTLLASADVVIAPGPVETFGLAALEAMACGTPVVCDEASALREVIDVAGIPARTGHGRGLSLKREAGIFADAISELLARPVDERRHAARRRAELFSWERAAAGFLDAYTRVIAGVGSVVRHPGQ